MNLKINPLFLFFGYGIVFFPLLLLIGPLFSELFLISVIIFSLFFIIKEKKEIFYKNRFFIFFLLFYISTIYSTLLNYYNLDLSISGIFYFRVLLFSFAIWFAMKKTMGIRLSENAERLGTDKAEVGVVAYAIRD